MPTLFTAIPPPAEFCNVPAVLPAVHVFVVTLSNNVIAAGDVGKISVNDTPVRLAGLVPGLEMTIVKTDDPPTGIAAGVKLLVIVGGPNTFSVPLAATPGGELEADIEPVVFTYAPTAAAVTLTSILQTPEFPIVNPLRVNVLPFAGAVSVNPVQVDVTAVMVAPGTAVLTKPIG